MPSLHGESHSNKIVFKLNSPSVEIRKLSHLDTGVTCTACISSSHHIQTLRFETCERDSHDYE